MPEIKKMQAKHISDLGYMATVIMLARTKELVLGYETVTVQEMAEALPYIPSKLIRAKFNQLEKRGFMDGCGCGCRGNFRVTDEGLRFIAELTVQTVKGKK